MKTSPATVAVLLVAALLAAQQLVHAQQASGIQCSDVVQDLTPCLGYLQGNEESPSDACCGGVTTLYAAAATTDDRRETCECLEEAYRQYDVLVPPAQALPGLCGVGLSYTITPDINCSTIA